MPWFGTYYMRFVNRQKLADLNCPYVSKCDVRPTASNFANNATPPRDFFSFLFVSWIVVLLCGTGLARACAAGARARGCAI